MMRAGKDYLVKGADGGSEDGEYESPRVKYLRELLQAQAAQSGIKEEKPEDEKPEDQKSEPSAPTTPVNQTKPTLKLKP